MKSTVLEVVLFDVKAGITPETLRQAAAEAGKFMDMQPGYQGRELAVDENGRWVDIVHWDSMENAHAAQEAAMQSPVCLSFFGMVDEATMQIYHFESALLQSNHN